MKNIIKMILLFASIFLIMLSCSKDDLSSDTTEPNYDMPTVLIGTQEWMQTNLDVNRYSNGDEIPQVTDPNEWINLTSGAWCYYENNSENGTTFGKLYNWYAVNDSRGIAPIGWHVPNEEEWTTLSTYLGGDIVAGGKMKSTANWSSPNKDGTNSSGFTGLPGGVRLIDGSFGSINLGGFWWSSTQRESGYSWYRALAFYDGNVITGGEKWVGGLSVRCLKD